MFKQLWNLIVKILIAVAVVLSVLFLAELARMFLLFYRVHPAAGFGFAGLLLLGLLVGLVALVTTLRQNAPVLVPPPLPELEKASHKEMRNYCRYLVRYLNRLAENGRLDGAQRNAASGTAAEIKDLLRHHPLNDDLRRAIIKTEGEVIAPLLESLREKGAIEVRRCVRDVMIGVTLNPYASVDILIVVYRNMAMVLRIIGMYRTRPALREQFLIFRDILMVVATVNFLNLNRKLLENLFAQIPIVGRFVDDIGQGVGAGILTSVTGHAAISRCAAFRGWDGDEEVASLGVRSTQFLADVKNLFTKDLLPEMKIRIRADVPKEQLEDPGFWDAIARGTATAVDMTARTLDSFIMKPAAAGVQGVATAGTLLAQGVVRGGSTVVRASARGSRSAFGGVTRIFRTFGQRVKYTLIGKSLHK